MSGKRYTDEFKVEAVRQVTDRGHSVAEVANRLRVARTQCFVEALPSEDLLLLKT